MARKLTVFPDGDGSWGSWSEEITGRDLDDYLDEPALARCSGCERKTWDPGEFGTTCSMLQPNGTRCAGVFVPER